MAAKIELALNTYQGMALLTQLARIHAKRQRQLAGNVLMKRPSRPEMVTSTAMLGDIIDELKPLLPAALAAAALVGVYETTSDDEEDADEEDDAPVGQKT